MPLLQQGAHVWVKDMLESGTVVSNAGTPRSYIIDTPRETLTRNRYHLSSTPKAPATTSDLPEVTPDDADPMAESTPVTPEILCDPVQQASLQESRVPTRVRVPPAYLKDFVRS